MNGQITPEPNGAGWRPSAFVLGLAAGALVAAGAGWMAWPFVPFVDWNVGIEVNGRDVDKHGGARIVIASERSRITQRCAGGCDDVQFHESTSDNAYEVKVLDTRGICVACADIGYVTNGTRTQLMISGQDFLSIEGGMAGLTPPPAPDGPVAGRETPTR